MQSAEGGHASADVVTEKNGGFYAKKHIGNVKYEDFNVEMGLNPTGPVKDWIEAAWTPNYQRKNGSIIANDFRYKEREVREFSNALISELTIPGCDGSSKEPGFLKLKIAPEKTFIHKSDGTIKGESLPSEQKKWLPANFRLTLDGLDTAKIAKIDSFTVKQSTATDDIGDARDYLKEPGKLEFPNLKITFHEVAGDSWTRWHEDFVIKGNNGDDKEKSGSIVYFDSNQSEELMRINLYQCGIFRLGDYHDQQASRYQVADLYCERMQIQFSGKHAGN